MNTPAHDARTIRLTGPRTAPLRAVLPVVAGLLLALLAVSPALGHAELETSDPAADAVLDTPPTVVTLTFSAGLDAGKSSFKVVGTDGVVGTGSAAKDGDTVMTADGLTLVAGTYTVEWTSVADDGDVERGTFSFTVTEPPATPTPAPTEAASAVPTQAASAVPSPSPALTPAPSEPAPSGETGTPAASGGDVLLPIIAALVLVAVVGFLVLRRTRSA